MERIVYAPDTDVREASGLINRLLHAGREVRIKVDYGSACTRILADGEIVAIFRRKIIYPGYLNLTKAGTPARICCLEDCGGFGAENLKGVNSWKCCMSHTYNDHDRENWYDPDEGGEDRHLDASYEKEFII